MRFRRVVPAIVGPAIALAGAATFHSIAAHAGTASAASAVGLPISSAYQVIADTAHSHLFISQGAGSDTILLTSLSGSPVATLADATQNMTLSPDGSTLYADNGGSVTAINTTTLQRTASYPLPSGDRAAGLAVQSGRLWVSYQNTDSSLNSRIGAIDLANGSADWNAVTGDWVPLAPAIAADPSDAGILVASSLGATPGTVETYNVSNPSAVSQTASSTSLSCGAPSELAVIPGGKTFLCGGEQYSTATLAQQNSPFMGSGPTAVAPDGALAVGSSSLSVAAPGASTQTDDYDQWWGVPLPAWYAVSTSSPAAFAWGADSQRLFTITESTSNDAAPIYQELTLYPFQVVPAYLSLTSTGSTVGYGEPVMVTPQLGMTYTNRSFSVYETIVGSARRLLWSGAADPGGDHVSFTVYPQRNMTFTMAFAGDARYKPTTVTLTVSVGVKIAAALSGYYRTTTISGASYRVYHRAATLKDAVTVTPAKHGECVQLTVQEYSKGVWRPDTTTKCGTLNKSSQAALPLKLTAFGRFRIRANYIRVKTDTANLSTVGPWQHYEVTK